jgi:hypothetical protein
VEIPKWRGSTQRRWLPSDHTSFRRILECIHWAHRGQTTLALPGRFLIADLDNFHTSLPFTEPERHRLDSEIYEESDDILPSDPVRYLRRLDVAAYHTGRQVEVNGQDMLNRWWAWRRNVLEFDDSEAVLDTMEALYYITNELLPELSLPAEIDERIWAGTSPPPYPETVTLADGSA